MRGAFSPGTALVLAASQKDVHRKEAFLLLSALICQLGQGTGSSMLDAGFSVVSYLLRPKVEWAQPEKIL